MVTMISPLRRATIIGADRVAASCGDVRLTYRQTWERCGRLAGALRGLGLDRGDRVALVATNCHRFLELYQTAPSAGYVFVPLNPRHTPAELRYAVADAGARVLFSNLTDLGLEDLVEHSFDLDEGYEALLAAADPVELHDGTVGEDGALRASGLWRTPRGFNNVTVLRGAIAGGVLTGTATDLRCVTELSLHRVTPG